MKKLLITYKLLLLIACWLLSTNNLFSQPKRDTINFHDLCFSSFCLGDSVQKVKKYYAINKIDTLVDDTGNRGKITMYIHGNSTIFQETPSGLGYINEFSTSDTTFKLNLYGLKIGSIVDEDYIKVIFPLSYQEMIENKQSKNTSLRLEIRNNPFVIAEVLVIFFDDMRVSGFVIINYE